MFYIALLVVLNNTVQNKRSFLFSFFIISLVALIIFLKEVEYGGERLNFSFAGLYLFMLSFLFLFFKSKISSKAQVAFLIPLTIMNITWSTYLLNAFLCNGWIFT
jgi:hypothetical protein